MCGGETKNVDKQEKSGVVYGGEKCTLKSKQV